MYVLKTAELARGHVRVPSVEAEGVKVGVRQQKKADVGAKRSQLVGQDGCHAVILRLPSARVGVADSCGKPAPLESGCQPSQYPTFE